MIRIHYYEQITYQQECSLSNEENPNNDRLI